MTRDNQTIVVKCIPTLLDFIVTISDTFFWKLWVYRNMEYAIFMPVCTSLRCATKNNQHLSISISLKNYKLWKVKSQPVLSFCWFLYSLVCHHPNFRGAFRYFSINWKTFQNKLIPLKGQFLVAKRWNIFDKSTSFGNLVLIKAKLAQEHWSLPQREPVSRSS